VIIEAVIVFKPYTHQTLPFPSQNASHDFNFSKDPIFFVHLTDSHIAPFLPKPLNILLTLWN
jgi:hypothetical protein